MASGDGQRWDVAIVGAGAAGLAAAYFAGEAARGAGRRIVVLDGARKLGAKILVSGGGRCNVTNERVTADDYWGGPRPVIRNVLRAFDERRTLDWMAELGVPLKLEPSGKYFPASDSARTVLDALLRGVRELGAEVRAAARVREVQQTAAGFDVVLDGGERIAARRVVMATGGLSLPKSGSDGLGLRLMAGLGHAMVPTTPALVPLVLGGPEAARFAALQGVTCEARLALREPSGRRLEERAGSLLFTHFGLSGPAALDLSRHWLRARLETPARDLRVTLGHPQLGDEQAAHEWLVAEAARTPRRQVTSALHELVPDRLAHAMPASAGLLADMTREQRRELARALTALALPVTGDRGYTFAETTAGGVALGEVDHRTMESRRVPGLHLCGEMLDVDGRIGGFNFQWAWSSGYLAGRGAVLAGQG
ncbi:MAG: aminoacetone oxidase family FAD-binding enzyme [Candidatus Sumerlaeia bacterium]|nr:aminoacetone oxidase family FAD-binding enzyme [Candidatus Sumerlaeia bacterium]